MSFLTEVIDGELSPYVLGAAQLGSNYGIANTAGKPERELAWQILSTAVDAGVRVVDTARAYGDSETIIGTFLERNPACPLHVVTKLAGDVNHGDADAVYRAVHESRTRIGKTLAAVLLHDASNLRQWQQGLCEGLTRCVRAGSVSTVGVSTYTPAEFVAALEIEEIGVIQAPFNALDRRLLDSGLLAKAIDAGRMVILRSVFLQGLLLMEQSRVPRHLHHALPDLRRWHSLCEEFGVSEAAAAIGYARAVAPRALLVLGSERPEQVKANAVLVNSGPLPDDLVSAISRLPQSDESVVNPSLWKRT